jgi:hypothetical protein
MWNRKADELQTELKVSQMKDLLRTDGKGGLYNALMKVAESS